MTPGRVVSVVIVVLIGIIIIQNTETVVTDVLLVSVSMPLALLLGITFVLGILVGMVVVLRRQPRGERAVAADVKEQTEDL